jgi:hypothetical protein
MRTLTIALALVALAPQLAQAGPGDRGGNGGKGYVIDGRLYLLDLAEKGLERRIKAPVDFGEDDYVGPPRSATTIHYDNLPRQPGYKWSTGAVNQQVVIRTERSGAMKVILVRDLPGLLTLRELLRKSEAPDWIFGRELYSDACRHEYRGNDGYRLPCFSDGSLLSIALAQKLAESIHVSGHPFRFRERFLDQFRQLRWTLIDAPLETIDDDSSTLAGQKYMLASRVDGQVGIRRAGWEGPASIDRRRVAPLDFWNRLALVTHEVLGAITQAQGDSRSDRAKLANASFWAPYSVENPLPHMYTVLDVIPGETPTGRAPHFVSELPKGQLIRVHRKMNFMSGVNDTYILTKGWPVMSWHALSNRRKTLWFRPRVELFNRNNSFWPGLAFDAGTTLEIVRTETHLKPDWQQTVIYFKNDGRDDQISYAQVTGGNGGKSPATIEEFKEAIGYHLELLPAPRR